MHDFRGRVKTASEAHSDFEIYCPEVTRYFLSHFMGQSKPYDHVYVQVAKRCYPTIYPGQEDQTFDKRLNENHRNTRYIGAILGSIISILQGF